MEDSETKNDSTYLEYPSCLQADAPSQLFQPSEQTVLQTPPLWTCRTELRPLRRTDRQLGEKTLGSFNLQHIYLCCSLSQVCLSSEVRILGKNIAT